MSPKEKARGSSVRNRFFEISYFNMMFGTHIRLEWNNFINISERQIVQATIVTKHETSLDRRSLDPDGIYHA